MPKKISTEDFIFKSNIIHNNKYDYSLVNYVNNKTKIKIICPIHGEFLQIPNNHLGGNGCIRCSIPTDTKDIFIIKAKRVHGEKYGYDNVTYINSQTKIKILCYKHGEFYQKPYSHLNGRGCKYCNGKHHIKDFIEKAKKVHENLYDYIEEPYIANKKVGIICKIHGIFFQTSNIHLSGSGCPNCFNKNESLVGDFLKELLNDNIKIEKQKRIDVKDKFIKNYIRVDYYFEIEEKKYIVEYNGEQHYKPFWKSKNKEYDFSIQQQRDEFLNFYCKNNNINLIEIDGRKFKNNNIRKFLIEIINNLK